MPFVPTHLSVTGTLGIWHITETTEELRRLAPLHPADRAYLSAIHHPQRYRQALAARVLTQHLLRSLGQTYAGIAKDNAGKPYLFESYCRISLSHTGEYAAVWLHPDGHPGIDIETIHEKIIRVGPRFLTDEERAGVADDPEKLTVYWCAKEAVYKLYRSKSLTFREICVKDPVGPSNGTLRVAVRTVDDHLDLNVMYWKMNTFILACCVLNTPQLP